jgi:hypothetical protein
VVRGNLLAVALVTVLAMVSTVSVAPGASGVGGMLAAGAFALLTTTCLIRFGLVALFAFFLTGVAFTVLRAALAWNTGMGMLILAAIVALTLAAAYIAMGLSEAAARRESLCVKIPAAIVIVVSGRNATNR